jgi:inositol transporter-like SP family MFS transporter
MSNQAGTGIGSADQPPEGATETDHSTVSRQQWKWTVLAGMASYLDAGSIVALASGLALFRKDLGLSASDVGILAAIGPNAIGCAIGAFIGGRLGDVLGRKRIYQWDLLVYALGVLIIGFAGNEAMLYIGTFIVGLTVGADVPTSLALVGEFAPAKARGKLLGFSQIAWNCGPSVVLLLALALASTGLIGIRIVFFQLAAVALLTWFLRRGMTESLRWKSARERTGDGHRLGALLRGANLRGIGWTTGIYLFWNIAAGTSGIFTPYMVSTLGGGGQAVSVGLSLAGFVIGILATLFIFMPLFDRDYRTRRTLWAIGAIMQILGWGVFVVLPFNIPTVIFNAFMAGVGGALAGEAVYKIFSQELFPTMLRGTAQGFTFGLARLCLGIWSLFVPILTKTSFTVVGGLLALFLAISGVIGFFFMPRTAGKTLEEIEAERGTA